MAAPATAARVIPLTCSGHTRPVVDLQFSPITADGTYYLISACKDGNPMLRDGQTGDWIGTFLGHKGAVQSRSSVAAVRLHVATIPSCVSTDLSTNPVSPPASAIFILTTSWAQILIDFLIIFSKVWDTFTGDVLHSFAHQHIIRSADFSDDGTRIVTGGLEKKLRIFDLYRPEAQPLEAVGHTGAIKSVVFDERRNVILSAGEDKGGMLMACLYAGLIHRFPISVVPWFGLHSPSCQYRVWDLRNLTQITTLEANDAITSMTLSSDGKYITSTAGKTAYFWDTSDYHLAKSYETQQDVPSISLHPDHSRFIAGSVGTDLWVRIYDFETGKELEVYKGHHGAIHTVSYSPDGEIYATGSEDGTIRLWQTTPGKSYGLWQNNTKEGENGNGLD
ncbi:WD40-repeat-containing domain protein [Endogone sp. FLAS-F59071]|nr:WD40-repeat-containing domain protein [Endogone sp. FLAS-F59071]|eukprot:RUS15593.1 WD40-repeat-containing domain protein [Endogone sp. FLAS-F59071]